MCRETSPSRRRFCRVCSNRRYRQPSRRLESIHRISVPTALFVELVPCVALVCPGRLYHGHAQEMRLTQVGGSFMKHLPHPKRRLRISFPARSETRRALAPAAAATSSMDAAVRKSRPRQPHFLTTTSLAGGHGLKSHRIYTKVIRILFCYRRLNAIL